MKYVIIVNNSTTFIISFSIFSTAIPNFSYILFFSFVFTFFLNLLLLLHFLALQKFVLMLNILFHNSHFCFSYFFTVVFSIILLYNLPNFKWKVVIILDFNEILNATIAGLICSIIVAISTILFKFSKKSYAKDSTLFWYDIFFYFDIFATVCNAINFRLDKCSFSHFSLGDSSNLIFFITLGICLICTLIQYNNIKKYIKQTNQA